MKRYIELSQSFSEGMLYVKGDVGLSPKALARLRKLGVGLVESPYNSEAFMSFEFPARFGKEFLHRPGNPSTLGLLILKEENRNG